jgi:hypothetical protein
MHAIQHQRPLYTTPCHSLVTAAVAAAVGVANAAAAVLPLLSFSINMQATAAAVRQQRWPASSPARFLLYHHHHYCSSCCKQQAACSNWCKAVWEP